MVYRQLSRKLRVPRGGGKPDLVSERPHREGRGGERVYLDSDDLPTLIEFDADCIVDVDRLLEIGAIQPWTAPPDWVERAQHDAADETEDVSPTRREPADG